MRPIQEWTRRQFRRVQDFIRRNAPYVVLGLFLAGFFVVFFFNSIVISIHSGELGILWRRLGGGTQIDTVYREGIHFILPFNRMYVYNTRKQQLTDTIDALTVDGLSLNVRYTVRYFLDKDLLPLLHQRVGPDYANVVIRPQIRSVIRVIFGQYKPEEIYATQKAIQERVSAVSKVQLEARFISLDDVPIESVKLPARISEAIEAKMIQQQIDQEYTYRISIANKESERQRIESLGIQNFNSTINSSLTPQVLAWHGVEATRELAKSPNSKVVVVGAGKNGLPLILGSQ